MTIEEFWNQAFLAALGRCSADEAKSEADRALLLCVAHWQRQEKNWSTAPVLWRTQPVHDVAHFQSADRQIE